MRNAQPVQKNQPGAKDALGKQPDYTPLQITVKALPWLALHAVTIVVVSLNAGGLAL